MDYYEILGIEKNSKSEEIRKAYYKLARENHPDKVDEIDKEGANKKFQKIFEAYEVLFDSEKRKIYDLKIEKKDEIIEVSGKVVYINPKNRKIFHIYEGKTNKKLNCLYEDFLPIQKGDAIFGFVRSGNYRNREFLTFISPPFVVMGLDKETILDIIKAGINIKKKYEDIYKIILNECKTDKNVSSFLDSIAIHYNYEELNYDPYILFSLVLDLKQFINLSNYWYKNRVLRNLYLLGLNNKEIRNSKINPLKLYEECLTNPYNVISLSLEKCDFISLRLGKTIEPKLKECGKIVRKIGELMENGWTSVPIKTLIRLFPNITEYLQILKENFDIKSEFHNIYLDYAYEVETTISDWIKDLLKKPSIFEIDNINYTREDLSDEQKKAVKMVFENNISIITGGAGSGKTTILKEIVHNLEKNGITYRIGSFTGKAVSRIREVIEKKEASTLHMMISSSKNKKNNFKCLILDESSMITSELLYEFRKRFSHDYKIIFVGDVNQLPPISWGALFDALIQSKKFPMTILKYIHRTENHSENGILINANRIILNKNVNYDGPPFEFEITPNFKLISGEVDTVNSLIEILNNNGIKSSDIVIISPYNKDLEVINNNCSSLYNGLNRCISDARGKIWRIGDRVMHTNNNYTANLTNGDEGIIIDVDYKSITVQFKGGTFNYNISSVSEENDDDESKELNTKYLILSFAVSVHRYQGSEIDYVIGYIPEGNSSFLNSNLLYTLITRCKKILWLVGDKNTMIRAATTKPAWRCCNLLQRLLNEK